MTRVKRRAYIEIANINWHPMSGLSMIYMNGGWNGKLLVDLPYYNRTDKAPPSHYTICARYNPLWAAYPSPHGEIQLGEIITVMGKDMDDEDVQFDFIAGLWPGVNYGDLGNKFAGDMTSGHMEGSGRGAYWVARTQYDGQQDNGVTCEEWATGQFFHSNTHRVSRAFYNPPAPPTGHYVQYPNIFGHGGDYHIVAVNGMYDCRAIDIPRDTRYSVIPLGPIQATIKANYDIASGADIRVGGQPGDLDVIASIIPPSGLIASTPVGDFPAAYLLAMDYSPNLGINSSIPAAIDLMTERSTMLIANAQFNPDDGQALGGSQMPTTISDDNRTTTMTWTLNNVGPIDWYDDNRGPDIAFSPAPPGQTLDITNTGYGTYGFSINGVPVNQVDTDRAGVMLISAPGGQTGDSIHVSIEADHDRVTGVTGQTQVDGVVRASSLDNNPQDPDVVVETPEAEPTYDPTATLSNEEMAQGYAGQADDEDAAGEEGDDNGAGGGNFSGGGGGPDGGNGEGGEGGSEGAE